MTEAEKYARWVLDPANAIRTGRLVKLACERFLSDLERTDIYFDEAEASHCINFIERYCLQWEGDWKGQAFLLQPWQKFALQNIYGWIKKNGKRRFTKAYIQIAKKNGKSSLSAGISLFHLLADKRINTPKVFTAANNEDQAKICVNMAGRIVEESPELTEVLDIRLMRYKENITEVLVDDPERGNGFIKALSKEGSDKKSKTSGGKHGINASLGVVDEFGLSQDHGNSKTIDTSMMSRPERLMLYITTAGYNMEGPCFRELRASGIKVLERTIEMDSYFPLIFEIDKPRDEEGKEQDITIDWLIANEQLWDQSNPNIDISVQRDALKDMLFEAQQYGGTQERETLTLNFNLWVDAASVFVSADVWNKNSHGLEDPLGEDCFGGLEIAPSGEISAMALVFPGDKIRVKMLYFAAEEAIKRNDTYRDWTEFIKIDPGNEVENEVAVGWIEEFLSRYNMHSFAFPNTQKNNSIVQALIKNGRQGNPLNQGMAGISNATEEYEKELRAFHVEHFSHPVLAYQNSCCMAVRKEVGTRIEKNPKVLGVYAVIDAIAQWRTIGGVPTLGILSL